MRRLWLLYILLWFPILAYGQDYTSNLLGWYKLDDASGTTAVDSGSGGNNGTLTGTQDWLTSGSCKLNGCFGFGGSDYFTVSSSAYLLVNTTTPTDFSIAGWIYLTDLSGSHCLYSEGTTDTFAVIYLCYQTSSGKYIFVAVDLAIAGNTATSTTAPSTGAWHHIAGTVDVAGHTLRLYVDGALEHTVTTWDGSFAATPVNRRSAVGTLFYGGATASMQGRLDEARLYTRKLTDADVTALYNSYSAVAPTVTRRRAISQ